jgi:signal transduction histidine kinase
MKRIVVLLVSMICLIAQGVAQNTDQIVEDSREGVSRDLIVLRDSVNGTLNTLQKNSTMAAEQHHNKTIQDLTRCKVQLDKAIDEVVNTKKWTKEIGDKTVNTVDDVRKEYRRIKEDLKEN